MIQPQSSLWRWRKIQTGSSLVEYALVLLVFLTLMFGIIDFGRALYTYHYVSSAARDAARWASVNGHNCADDGSCNGTGGMNSGQASVDDIKSYVTNHVPPAIDTSKLHPTASWTAPNGPTICTTAVNGQGPYSNYPGCTVVVTVSYVFSFDTPIVFNKTMTLSSTSEMVIVH